jgi:hypothetical protein
VLGSYEFFNDCFVVFEALAEAEQPQAHAPSFWVLLNT